MNVWTGDDFKTIRKRMGYSQSDIAKYLRVSKQAISYAENTTGKNKVSDALLHSYYCTLYLLYLTDNKVSKPARHAVATLTCWVPIFEPMEFLKFDIFPRFDDLRKIY